MTPLLDFLYDFNIAYLFSVLFIDLENEIGGDFSC